MTTDALDCDICSKHRGEGPLGGALIVQRDGFWVYHAPSDGDGISPLGYLFIESDRHAPYLADLDDAEAAALGRLRTRLARALRAELDVEFVFAIVIGRGIAHFHEHLVSRFRGTPDAIPWDRSDEAAPPADGARVADLVERLARRIDTGA